MMDIRKYYQKSGRRIQKKSMIPERLQVYLDTLLAHADEYVKTVNGILRKM